MRCDIITLQRDYNEPQGGENMKPEDRKVVRTLSEAFQALPDNKKEYLIGFAEGVVAAKNQENEKEADRHAS